MADDEFLTVSCFYRLQMYAIIIFLHVKHLCISSHVTTALPPREQQGQRLNLCAHTQREDDRGSLNRTGWYGVNCGGKVNAEQFQRKRKYQRYTAE